MMRWCEERRFSKFSEFQHFFFETKKNIFWRDGVCEREERERYALCFIYTLSLFLFYKKSVCCFCVKEREREKKI